jgi:phosphoserine phosphatase
MIDTPDPLPSWNAGAAKEAILAFIDRVTAPGPDFVPPAERIAVFDNDGTLWAEYPMPVQAYFVFDRLRALAPEHPEWREREPFAAALRGDVKATLASGERGLLELVMATHAGMTTDEFERLVTEWIATAQHPATGRRFVEMVYHPMLELMDCLRAAGFRTFIMSAGGVEFMRPWAEATYGIPPEQVIGSAIVTRYEVRPDGPVLVRLPELDFLGDKAAKPVGIFRRVGRRPVAAFGNSDGDFEMLEWTTSGPRSGLPRPGFGLLVHHDDAAREFAYDRQAFSGKLDRGLDEAAGRGWTLVSMARDWARVF